MNNINNTNIKHKAMNTPRKPATSKLVASFDNELQNILSQDLKAFMARNPFLMRKKQAMTTTLSVA